MKLPPSDKCPAMIAELNGFYDQLTETEKDFVVSNRTRTYFTEPQRSWLGKLAEKYEMETWPE